VLSTGPLDGERAERRRFRADDRAGRRDRLRDHAGADAGLAEEAFLTGEHGIAAGGLSAFDHRRHIRIANATARSGDLSLTADAEVSPAGAISGQAACPTIRAKRRWPGRSRKSRWSSSRSRMAGSRWRAISSPVTGYLTQRALEKEQARVEALQARLLEKQRLRREVQLYTFRKRSRMQASKNAAAPAGGRTDGAPAAETRLREDAAAVAARRLADG
jgi:hypothetical protein